MSKIQSPLRATCPKPGQKGEGPRFGLFFKKKKTLFYMGVPKSLGAKSRFKKATPTPNDESTKKETKIKNLNRKREGFPVPRRQKPGAEATRVLPRRRGRAGSPGRRPRPATSPSQSAPRASRRRCRVMTHFRRAPVPRGLCRPQRRKLEGNF